MTFTASRAEIMSLVAEASRAPSVHNIQPARWRFMPDGSVILFRALDRVLPVADPTGHDVQASLGAAFEGMAIAVSARGGALSEPTAERSASAAGCEPVARARILTSAEVAPDPLAAQVSRRRSFRGRFDRFSPQDVAALGVINAPDVRLIAGADRLVGLAELHDAATWAFESQPEYHAELWSWLRLSPRDPRYRRDGLTADCLALSRAERWAAARLLAPRRFSLLAKLGIARHLISEAPQVRSASAAIAFCPRRDAVAFDVGRRMYRFWLEVTAAGFHLVPMSASADDSEARGFLEKQLDIPPDRRLANVFRVGRVASREVAESPRLPADELLV